MLAFGAFESTQVVERRLINRYPSAYPAGLHGRTVPAGCLLKQDLSEPNLIVPASYGLCSPAVAEPRPPRPSGKRVPQIVDA